MNPPPGWKSDEVLAAEVIAANPEASPAKLGCEIIRTLRENFRLLLPPTPSEKPQGKLT